jgi:hypothetical protein
MTPGRYHVTVQGGGDLGWHDVVAGQITYVGLYPVWLPKVRGNYNGWNSMVVVRNNSSAFTAQVNTTFFKTNGEVQEQRTNNIAPNAVAYLPAPTPPEGFYGSAVVVSSEDVAVALKEQNSNDGRADAYDGLAASDSLNPGWGQVGTDIHLPDLMDNNYGWSTSVTILNAGSSSATLSFDCFDQGGGRYSISTTPLAPNASTTYEQGALPVQQSVRVAL